MTETKFGESKEIESARDLLRDAIDSLSEGFALYDDERRLVMFNKRYAEMNQGVSDLLEPGLDWEILMRESAKRGIYAEAIGQEEGWIADRLENGIEYIQEYELLQTDGRTYQVSVHPTELGGFVVTKTDITERKQVEAAQSDSELLIRTVLDGSSAIVVMARIGDGQIIYRSPASLELFGNTKSAHEHYLDPNARADYITQLLADGYINDYRISAINADGNTIEISVSGRIAEFKGEEVVVTSIVDLTEQLEADALIRKVVEACPVPVQMTKVDTGELLFRSPETISLFGPADTSKAYYESAEKRRDYIETLRKLGEVHDFRTVFKNSKGENFWGAVSARLIEYQGEEVVVSNTRDLTSELALQEELERQREMIFQNEKMSAMGELLAGVAHELNNPLSVVVGHSLMMKEEVSDPEALSRIEKISNAAERCAKIVKTFLAMARQQPAKIENVDVNTFIDTALDVVGYGSQSEGIKIERALGVGLPEVAADSDQITQVLINLILNAEQAIKKSGEEGKIIVSTSLKPASNMVEIVVADDGPGIPENIRGRIFEPFFTTKEVGEGTGIGLAFCHRIILSHGGQISLDPSYKNGTRFRIFLPVTVTSSVDNTESAQLSDEKGKRTALVVDDEIEVGELTAEILRKDGFVVEFVSSGAEALAILKEKSFNIFLSDLNMPDIDGAKIYKALLADFPHMINRTAFITGDTMGASSQKLLRESNLPHMEKPISPTELRELVGGILAKTEEAK